MSSKLGTILSLLFVTFVFLFGVDLVTLQYSYSDLDAKSVAVSYLVSQHGSLETAFVTYLEEKYAVTLNFGGNTSPLFGDVIEYVISKEYQPMILSSGPMTLSIKREVIIGYYQ